MDFFVLSHWSDFLAFLATVEPAPAESRADDRKDADVGPIFAEQVQGRIKIGAESRPS
jgi:hypothetical protein